MPNEGLPVRDPSTYPRFSAVEMGERHAATYRLIEDAKVDGLLVYSGGHWASELYWLTDTPAARESYTLMQPGRDPVVLMQFHNHMPLARSLSIVEDIRWGGPRIGRAAANLLKERGLERGRVGLVGSIPFSQYLTLKEVCPDADFVDLGGRFRMMRTIKSPAEIERLRIASELTDRSMQALADELRPGIRENELPAIIEPVYLKAGGYAGIHFMTTMPMRQPGFPVPAQHQSNRVIERGDCLITEISGFYQGYGGQIHRTYSLGEGPTPEWRALHDVAVEAFNVIFDTIRDGVSSREVEEAADVIHRRGYTIYDDLLHGNSQHPPVIQTKGAKRHEDPDVLFRENMCVVIQPNVITPDEKMGLQFGETVVVGKNGCETLNAFPREWIICPA